MLIAIDPGTKHAGVSVWGLQSRRLLLAFGVRTEGHDASAEILAAVHRYIPNVAVIEAPQEYQSRPGVRADDLVTLALLCGELRGAIRARWCCPVEYCKAPDWKGGLPKPEKASETYIVERRCRKILSPEEASCVTAPNGSKSWDVWDAVGIGAVAIGRAARGLRPIKA